MRRTLARVAACAFAFPAFGQAPAPDAAGEPVSAPAVIATPAPAANDAPVPAASEAPAPAVILAPVPASNAAPADAAGDAPAPAASEAPPPEMNAAPAPAASEPAAAAAAAELDPARIAAARQVVEQLLPGEEREAMIASLLAPMMANIRQALAASPQFTAAFGSDARLRGVLDRFLARQNDRMLATLRDGLPGMIEAMARAYARRFSLDDLAAYRAFFATDAGRRYMREGAAIMSDPDVAGWQRAVMTRSMEAIPGEIAQLTDEIAGAAETGR